MKNKIGVTQGKWYVSDIIQSNGFYIYSKHDPFEAIARVYKSDDRPNAENDANIIVDAVNNQCKLINENEELKARCETYKKDYDSMVAEVLRLSGENSELLEALSNLIKVSEEPTKDIVAFENADILDNCIDKAKAVITK